MDLKEKAKEQMERAKEFNRKPPVWAYWVLGIAIIILAQVLRTAL